MGLEEKILFQLGIKGVSPDQIDAVARQTGDHLLRSMRVQYEKLRQAHQDMLAAQGKDAIKAADERIKQEERVLAAMEKIRRSAEIQANKDANPFSGVMGMLQGAKNVLHIGEMIKTAVTGAVQAFEELSGEIIRTTQIYGALKGSIDDAKAATGGEVSNLDLIIAKNRSVQMEMNLTDKQFALIAESAKGFADAVGTDTSDALNQLVTGIGTAREKTLKLMGVFVDAKQVYEDLARVRGVTVDQLTEEEKRTAFQTEALRLLELRLETVVEKADTFANQLERFGTSLKNAKTETQNSIGSSTGLAAVLSVMGDAMVHVMAVTLPGGEQIAVSVELEEQAKAFGKLNRDAMAAAHAINAAAAAQRAFGLAAYGGDLAEGGQNVGIPFLGKQFQERKAMKGGAKKTPLTKDQTDLERRRKAASNKFLDDLFAPRRSSEGESLDQDFGFGENADEKEAALISSLQTEKMRITEALIGEGRGLSVMEQVIFGPVGSDQWLENMQTTSDSTIEALGMVKEAGIQMAGAMGEAYADLLSGDAEASFAKLTHTVLKGLSAQAATRAVMELAEGIALSFINPVEASTHYAAAALFGSVATVAGVGSRAIGGGGGHPGSGVPTSRRTSEFSGGGGRSGGGDGATINIHFANVLPGTEAEIGDKIKRYLESAGAKTGRPYRSN